MNKSHLAVISGFLVAFLFGLTFMFINKALIYTTPTIFLAYRFFVAFIVLTVLIKLKLFKINFKNKNLLPLILIAIINPVINFITEANALRYITTIQVAVFLSLVPIVVMILSRIFLKEKSTPLQTIFIILSVSGVVITIIDSIKTQVNTSTIGIILVVGTVLSVALHGLLTKHFSKGDYSANEVTYVMVTVGFIVFASAALIKSPIKDIIEPLNHTEFIVSILYLAIAASVVAYGLYNFMYSTISTAATSVFINLTTVVSTIVGVVILNESLSTTQILGCILITLGVIGANVVEYKKT